MTDFQQYQLGTQQEGQVSRDSPNGQDFVSSPNVLQTSKTIIVGGQKNQISISPDKGLQIGTAQGTSNLASFQVTNDGTGDIQRVGAIKLASANDLGVTTLNEGTTGNKVIYASANDLHLNVPTTTAHIYLDVNGVPYQQSGSDPMTYAATISLDTTKPDLHTTTTVNATGNATINASTTGIAGQKLYILITNDATSNKTITFGTNFKPSATLVGTTSKSAVVSFISDGTNFYEVSRTTGL